VYSLSTPNISELLLNVGVSVSLFFISWWQWENFKESKKLRYKNKQVNK
jgi:DNA-binding transcriptional regulator of glucitol operon